jgi:hypothetical protein
MDALRVAAPLARLLLAVGEAGCQGEVAVSQRGRAARLSIAGGRLAAITGVDHAPLGDTLLALGALHPDSQRAVLGQQASGSPIGARLIAAGATSSAAVACALEVQLAEGVHALLCWPATRVELVRTASVRHARQARGATSRFDTPGATAGFDTPSPAAAHAVTIDVAGAVWSALWVIASELPAALCAQLSGTSALLLTSAGRRRVGGLLRAVEAGELGAAFRRRAFARRLRPGQVDSLPAVLSAAALAAALRADPGADQHVLRAMLRVLGAAIERPVPEDAYALLLRKHRQLSRNVSASALLDLPEAASAEHARRALRRLAQKLHPDRFLAGDARLYAVSNAVMGALARAENTLRVRAHDSPRERSARA